MQVILLNKLLAPWHYHKVNQSLRPRASNESTHTCWILLREVDWLAEWNAQVGEGQAILEEKCQVQQCPLDRHDLKTTVAATSTRSSLPGSPEQSLPFQIVTECKFEPAPDV